MTTMPAIFRAERLNDELSRGERRYRRETLRVPVNVPFIVDNLWEYLRPDHMPCRRHAVFACTKPAQALASCTASQDKPVGVYQVVIEGPAKVAQLQVDDAKRHPDIAAIMRMLPARVGELDDAGRQAVALLFLPGARKEEWAQLGRASAAAAALMAEMAARSTFWSGASATIGPGDGEVFFELEEGASYVPRNLLYPG